jgi:hypothetical protein
MPVDVRELELRLVPHAVAAEVIVRHHYLHAMCAGARLSFGVFFRGRLLGAIVLNAGPLGAHRLVRGATTRDCLSLARLWLADELPHGSESRALALLVRALRRHTAVRFLVSYADPSVAPGGIPHVGYVYQAANWLYTGLSEPQPSFDLGDGYLCFVDPSWHPRLRVPVLPYPKIGGEPRGDRRAAAAASAACGVEPQRGG